MTRLLEVIERSAAARHLARIGREEEILVEGPSKKDAALLTGRTRQNKLVHFAPAGAGVIATGSYARVRIDAAASHFLRGTLLPGSVLAPAPRGLTRRVTIPVVAV
jgi:tRNA-2-methylthio-N6-dimethylallyladenosine synthase